MEFHAKLLKDGLYALSQVDEDQIKKLKLNVEYKFKVTQPRNGPFHRKGMALFNLAYQNQEHFNNFDSCRKWITMSAGHYVETITPTGVMYDAKSLAWDKMDNTEFEQVYSDVLDFICKWLKIDNETLAREVASFM
jgi:hypothetical protein